MGLSSYFLPVNGDVFASCVVSSQVVGLAEVGFCVVSSPVVGPTVVGFSVVGSSVDGPIVVGFSVVSSSVIGLPVGFLVVGSSVAVNAEVSFPGVSPLLFCCSDDDFVDDANVTLEDSSEVKELADGSSVTIFSFSTS